MFPCTKCGACCRRVSLIPDFPEPILENGHCSHLLPDNSCAIYESRPEVCRIDDFMASMPDISKKEYYRLNAQLCNKWMDEDGSTSPRVVV